MKNLMIRAVGKLPETWQRDAVHIYTDRLKPFGGIEVTELPEGHGGAAKPDEAKTKKIEAESLLKRIPDGAFVVALDETGKSLSSRDFSEKLRSWSEEGGRTVVFLIGGSWGLSADLRKRADSILALGPMTLPHGLARVVLIEQLYRAKMIQSGKTYHK